jgi:hypothetical protein
MTKKEMIQTIRRLEAAAFLECKRMQKEYGKESDLHKSARTRFCAINEMMKAIGIEADYQLPDNLEAFKLLCELA